MPPKPGTDDGEEDKPKNLRRSMRKRLDSNGSTRNAFYANPMPEPYARRKRASVQNPISSSDLESMDFSSVVNMAIAQEGGSDQLSGLVGKKPGLHRSSSNPEAPDETPKEGMKKRRQKRTSADEVGKSNQVLKKKASKSLTGDATNNRKYGTLGPDSKEKSMKGGFQSLTKQHSSHDDSFGLSQETIGSDHFFDGKDLSPTRPLSPGFSNFGQVEKGKDQHSLRYSDRSFELPTNDELRRSSLLGGEFLTSSSKTIPKIGEAKNRQVRNSEIADFAKMVQAPTDAIPQKPLKGEPPDSPEMLQRKMEEPDLDGVRVTKEKGMSSFAKLRRYLDPTMWMIADIDYVESEDGDAMIPIFPEDNGEISIRILLRRFVFNPLIPEFSSVQQFVWSIIIGVAMGLFTAAWKYTIEMSVDFLWVTVPTFLKNIGFFTDLDGWFPLVHYVWICPTIFGGLLSYAFAVAPNKIPGQNEWITSLHSKGVQDASTFGQLFVLSTLGMASGLSLGPELPLVLTAGMAGSYLAILTKQTVLQARILNLVAAGSAVGGFFGFPMAGALFVLEIPHREGLQYFEALSPAIFGSIVAVLANRMIVNNDVTGYYKYPFLTDTLPSSIFWHAVIFGLYGAAIGIGYAKAVLKLKAWVHDIFHKHDDHEVSPADEKETAATSASIDEETGMHQESTPLFGGKANGAAMKGEKGVFERLAAFSKRVLSFGISYEPHRALVSGAVAGFLVGVSGMFIPHSLFWGEAQLQNLIDKGRTPLPIFGRGDDPTADLTAWAFCMIDSEAGGFSLPCSAAITISKIFVTGLSLGTGIIGGHFWGPLFTGCIASHFFTDFADSVGHYFGVSPFIGTYPCVAILCTMGATHVVTFRAHTAIMLILTLTITAFNPLDSTIGYVAGDYSAVFPLLVVAVYVSLMVSKDRVTFYSAQRNRGDIMALPEVLCEPGKFGTPMAFDVRDDSGDEDDYGTIGSDEAEQYESFPDFDPSPQHEFEVVTNPIVDAIEHEFSQMSSLMKPKVDTAVPAAHVLASGNATSTENFGQGLSSAGLDALLAVPLEKGPSKSEMKAHRRTRSAAAIVQRDSLPPSSDSSGKNGHRRTRTMMSVKQEGSSRSAPPVDDRLVRVNSYGLVSDFQPSLVEQARARASSLHRRLPSLTRHSRKNSADLSVTSAGGSVTAAPPADDSEPTIKPFWA